LSNNATIAVSEWHLRSFLIQELDIVIIGYPAACQSI
jgi:hypothetical protein